MNNRAVLCSLATILLFASLICIGCKQQPSPPSPPSIVEYPGPSSDNVSEKTFLYTNTDNNFSFRMTGLEFELFENYHGFNVALLGPYLWDLKTRINIVIRIGELPKEMSLNDYVKNDIKKAEKIYENYEIIDQYSTTIDGLPAEVVVFTFTKQVEDEIAKYKNISVMFINDNNICMIKYDVPEEFHKEHLPYFNSIISTFQFNDN